VVFGLASSVPAAMTAACAPARPCSGGIFLPTDRPGSVDPGPSPAVRRLRRVEVDRTPAASSAAHRITLNLFPDVCVTADRERATDLGGGRVQWEGRVRGAPPGTVTLIIDATLMVGTARIGRDVYEIRYLGDGVHAVAELEPSAFRPD
jgi:hypothetical protein